MGTAEDVTMMSKQCDMCNMCADEYLAYTLRKHMTKSERVDYLTGVYCRKCKQEVFGVCVNCGEQKRTKQLILTGSEHEMYNDELVCSSCYVEIM